MQTAPAEPPPQVFARHLVGRFVQALAERDEAGLDALIDEHTQLSYAFEPGESDQPGRSEYGLGVRELLARVRFAFDPKDVKIVEHAGEREVRVTLSWPAKDDPDHRGWLTLVYRRSEAGRWVLKNVRLKERAGKAR